MLTTKYVTRVPTCGKGVEAGALRSGHVTATLLVLTKSTYLVRQMSLKMALSAIGGSFRDTPKTCFQDR